MTKIQQTPEAEVLARVRRIETRLTHLMLRLGVNTQADKPVFQHLPPSRPTVQVPSVHSSLQEILDSVPESWQGLVDVRIGATTLATIVY